MGKIICILFVGVLIFNLFIGDFKIINRSQNDIEIKVYNQSRLIHHHIMHPGDVLIINQFKGGILVHWKMNEVYCGGKFSIEKPAKGDKDIGNGWIESYASEWSIQSSLIYKWIFKNGKCKQV